VYYNLEYNEGDVRFFSSIAVSFIYQEWDFLHVSYYKAEDNVTTGVLFPGDSPCAKKAMMDTNMEYRATYANSNTG